MRYIPVLPEDREEMLKSIGVDSIEELFKVVPDDIRIKGKIDLPKRLSELDLVKCFQEITLKNVKPKDGEWRTFLGAGAYEHFVPAAVDHLVSRSEFYTAYTPYQPELSQGTLQTIFEFQSLMAAVSGMEVSNASMYDGASALAEAVLMAERINKRGTVLMSELVHPEYKEVVKTYASRCNFKFGEIPFDGDGFTNFESVAQKENICCIVVQYPNFFGIIDSLRGARKLCDETGALLVVVTTEPIALGVLKPPGEFGCDIFVAEGQSFGNPVNFGGPHLGVIAAKKDYVRNMPGRIVSQTQDIEGKPGYVLYMATREQHIRREKATSNICTNNALVALRALIYLSLLGRGGFENLACKNLANAQYLKGKLSDVIGVDIRFGSPTFNEFVYSTRLPAGDVLDRLREEGIVAGVPIGKWWKDFGSAILVSVTEVKSKHDMDSYVSAVKKIM